MSTTKKIFVFSASTLLIVLLFWGLYLWLFQTQNNSSSYESNDSSLSLNKILPKLNDPTIKIIVDSAVLNPAFDADNQIIRYYSKETGQAFSVNFDGQSKQTLSDKSLIGLSSVTWSPNQRMVISQFNRSNNQPDFFYFNYKDNASQKLKNNLDTVIWYNDNKILYKYFDSAKKERTLNVANPDGSEWKKIIDVDYSKMSLAAIPKSGLISFWNSPKSNEETKLQSVSLLGGEIKALFQGKFGADYLWSPNGNRLLISHLNEKNGSALQLATTNSQGGEYANLDIPTMASKCAWSSDENTIYYALPTAIPNNAILPDDYQDKKITTTDTFWKVNIKTGKKDHLIAPEKITENIDATQLFLTPDLNYLFFVNRVNDKLYRLSL